MFRVQTRVVTCTTFEGLESVRVQQTSRPSRVRVLGSRDSSQSEFFAKVFELSPNQSLAKLESFRVQIYAFKSLSLNLNKSSEHQK